MLCIGSGQGVAVVPKDILWLFFFFFPLSLVIIRHMTWITQPDHSLMFLNNLQDLWIHTCPMEEATEQRRQLFVVMKFCPNLCNHQGFQIKGGQMKEKHLNEFIIWYLWASVQLVRAEQQTADLVSSMLGILPVWLWSSQGAFSLNKGSIFSHTVFQTSIFPTVEHYLHCEKFLNWNLKI